MRYDLVGARLSYIEKQGQASLAVQIGGMCGSDDLSYWLSPLSDEESVLCILLKLTERRETGNGCR